MRVLLDATVMQLPATGIAKSTLCLYDACLKLRPELQVSALHRQPLKCVIPSNMHSEQRVSFLPGFAWRKFFLPLYVTVNHPAAIHFPWNGNVPRGLSNAVVITTLNDVLPLVIPGYFKSSQAEENYRKIVQQDLDRTDLLMTISEYSKDEIIKNFVVKNEPVVVPLGPTLAAYNGLLPQTTKKLDDYFIYVGGYDPRKGIDKLIKVFIDLHREKRLCSKLILTGSKNYYSTEFKQLIDEGIQRGIVVEKGYVQDQELVQLIAGAIALIYPSKYEGFGLPPLEAMALGCPVITTGCTAVPEVCGDAAWYIDPDDNLEFANGIIMLQNDKELRLVLKSKGYKQAAKFSWELSAMKFMANLTSVCQSKQ